MAGGTCPWHGAAPSRRGLLLGLGAAAGSAALTGSARAEDRPNPVESDATQDRIAFYGRHQAGIVTPEPAAALIVAFDVLAEDRAGLERLLKLLTSRLAFLTVGGTPPALDDGFPPADSGILGPTVFPDNLTATVSVGASLFDKRFGLEALKPKRLIEMERFSNDTLDNAQCHGDLLIQFNANTAETNIHALRDIIRQAPDLLAPQWKIEGFLPPYTVKTQGKDTVRNFLGFKDGTANLSGRDEALMDEVVWLGEGADEPAWTHGGTYHVVRIIRTLVERWDRTPLGEQQEIIGREKHSGAPLGMAHERDIPDYASDPDGTRIPLDAHIRLANPRTAQTQDSRILRRAYNYSRGLTTAGQLDMGLLFQCFQADLDKGFRAVQQRLDGEPLEEYIKPVGGGYFFALPGVPDESGFLGEGLLKA